MEKDIRKKCESIAERLYELDGKVYECVGSSLGRTFTGRKDKTIHNLAVMMYTRPDGHLIRSEMALVSNMARTIKDKKIRSEIMSEYNEILQEILSLRAELVSIDILDTERAQLNTSNFHQKFSEDDHTVICISRTHGSAGNDIGFALADSLKINYYDQEIFDQVLNRMEAEKDGISDSENMLLIDKYKKSSKLSLKKCLKDCNRYHGLPRQDALFFNMSDLICELAQKEDCIIMGRCADLILKNHNIPHVSLFIDAPFQFRVQRIMAQNNMKLKQAIHFLKKMDRQHQKYYNFYSGGKWGNPEYYDLCINSSSYGLQETVDIITRMLKGV